MAPNSKLRKGDYFAALEMQGRRENMEDTSTVFAVSGKDKTKFPESVLFGVYDGHGGEECSTYCADNICDRIAHHDSFPKNSVKAIKDAFSQVDDEYVEMAEEMMLDDGSTATVLHVHYDEKKDATKYFLACTGDSRAILVKKNGKSVPLSDDHVPLRPDERLRVERDGGEVLYDIDNAIYRVSSPIGGGLAVTRAIGDMYFKPYVTSEPEIEQGTISDDDLYICLASDGLWGDVSNEEAAEILCELGVLKGVKELANTAYLRGSEDNITIIVVDLHRTEVALKSRVEAAKKPTSKPDNPSKVTSEKRRSRKSSKRSSRRSRTSVHDIAKTTRPALHSRKSSGILIVAGLDPEGFVTELLLWKKPLRTALWFLTILLTFFLTNVVGYSVVTLTCNLLILQLLGSVLLVRTEPLLKKLRIVDSDFDAEIFIRRSSMFTDEVVQRAKTTSHQIAEDSFEVWETVVQEGSTNRVLIALRNISYLFTPIAFSNLMFILAIALFSLPVTYVNNKITMDVYQARFSAWWHRTSNSISRSTEPVTNGISSVSSGIGSGIDTVLSTVGVLNKEKLKVIIGKPKKPKRQIVPEKDGSFSSTNPLFDKHHVVDSDGEQSSVDEDDLMPELMQEAEAY